MHATWTSLVQRLHHTVHSHNEAVGEHFSELQRAKDERRPPSLRPAALWHGASTAAGGGPGTASLGAPGFTHFGNVSPVDTVTPASSFRHQGPSAGNSGYSFPTFQPGEWLSVDAVQQQRRRQSGSALASKSAKGQSSTLSGAAPGAVPIQPGSFWGPKANASGSFQEPSTLLHIDPVVSTFRDNASFTVRKEASPPASTATSIHDGRSDRFSPDLGGPHEEETKAAGGEKYAPRFSHDAGAPAIREESSIDSKRTTEEKGASKTFMSLSSLGSLLGKLIPSLLLWMPA